MHKTDNYHTVPISQVCGGPVGKAKFKEPIFKLGVFQNDWIEVLVDIYPIKVVNPGDKKIMIGVRFGEMNVIRYVYESDLYDVELYNKK